MSGWKRTIVGLFIAAFMWGCGDEPTATDSIPPARVQDLTTIAVTDSTATISWTAPGDDDTEGQAWEYDLRYGTKSPIVYWETSMRLDTLGSPQPPGSTEEATIGGLTEGTYYFFVLKTADEAQNWSEVSNWTQAKTGDSVPPSAVTDLAAEPTSHKSIELTWSAPGENGMEGTAAAYDLRVSMTPITEENWEEAAQVEGVPAPQPPGSPETREMADLDDQETYYFALKARDDGLNEGPLSNVASATTTPDLVPPAEVTDLAVVAVAHSTVTLGWTAPGDDGTEDRAEAYDLRYASEPVSEATWETATQVPPLLRPLEPGTAEQTMVLGLDPGATYHLALRTRDERHNWSGLSNGVSVTLPLLSGRSWRVRADGTGGAPTVQAGIDSAAVGDTVLVYPGRYIENIDFLGKDIVVRSVEGAESTILDGSGEATTVVLFNKGESRSAVLEGFTITGGVGYAPESPSGNGGGVYCNDSSPTIRHNMVEDNFVEDFGGGIFVRASTRESPNNAPLIEHNVFQRNQAYFGGALSFGHGSTIVRHNIFRNNRSGSDGGAIVMWQDSGFPVIEDNEFWENYAYDKGGAIAVGDASHTDGVIIRRNLFVRNIANGLHGIQGAGGGLFFTGTTGEVSHNTFVSNDGSNGGGWCAGGGITLANIQGELQVFGNIIATNNGCGIACTYTEDPGFVLGPNLFWNNIGPDLGTGYGECPSVWSEDQIYADPEFCDPYPGTDYRVSDTSPALAGSIKYGAFLEPGCSGSSAAAPSWGRLRNRYR